MSISIFIDNVNVTIAGDAPVVTNPTVSTSTVSNIGQTAATLNATIKNPDGVAITAKGFELKATQGGTYVQVAGTGAGNAFSANLSALSPSTSYTYKAYITYNGITVYGNELTFNTLAQGVEPCDVPTGLSVSNVGSDQITITWDNNSSADSWNIQYRPENGQLASATSLVNNYTIQGLMSGTTYRIQVQANCGSGNLSEWSDIITVTTTGIHDYLENSVLLFPNPAKEVVNVQCTEQFYDAQVEVLDVYGKLLQTLKISSENTQINVSGLANGMYFVRVTTEQGVVTKRFVKK